MKNRNVVYHHQSAKIYRHHYKPSFNIFRLLKSILAIFISGATHVASSHYGKK